MPCVQEHRTYTKYVNSLISRSAKLSDLVLELESYQGHVEGTAATRLTKS